MGGFRSFSSIKRVSFERKGVYLPTVEMGLPSIDQEDCPEEND